MDQLTIDSIRDLLTVFLVLLLLAPAIYYTTRWYGGKVAKRSSIEIKEALPLGKNRWLYVVQWKQYQFLLGVTNDRIQVLVAENGDDREGFL